MTERTPPIIPDGMQAVYDNIHYAPPASRSAM